MIFVSNVLIDYWEKKDVYYLRYEMLSGGSCGSAESAEQLNFMVLSEDGMSIYIGSMRCSRKI